MPLCLLGEYTAIFDPFSAACQHRAISCQNAKRSFWHRAQNEPTTFWNGANIAPAISWHADHRARIAPDTVLGDRSRIVLISGIVPSSSRYRSGHRAIIEPSSSRYRSGHRAIIELVSFWHRANIALASCHHRARFWNDEPLAPCQHGARIELISGSIQTVIVLLTTLGGANS